MLLNSRVAERSYALSTLQFPSTLSRAALCVALSSAPSHESLVAILSRDPNLAQEFARSAGLLEGHSVGAHTVMVLNQRQKYEIGKNLPTPDSLHSPHIGTRGVDSVLAVHDLAKFVEGEEKNKKAEHQRTLDLIRPYLDLFPFSSPQQNLMLALISNDSLGRMYKDIFKARFLVEEKKSVRRQMLATGLTSTDYHTLIDRWENLVVDARAPREDRDRHIATCSQHFIENAPQLGLTPRELLRYQTVFYQADTTAYTWDARIEGALGSPSLDYMYERNREENSPHLFKVDPASQLLKFSPAYAEVYAELQERIG